MVSIVLWGQSPGADDGDGQDRHSGDRGGTAVVADGQAAEGQQPGDGAFHHPAVPAETFAGVHPDPRDAGGDASPAQVAAHPAIVVGLVRVQLPRPASRASRASTFDRAQAVQDWLHQHGVMPVGPGDRHRQRQPVGRDQQVVLGAEFAAIGRVGPGQLAPLFARTLTESRQARDQSSAPSCPSFSSTAW